MVNPGHPSRGCQPCKAAKTKCDQARPSCGRCVRRGTTPTCVYPIPSFRSMNQWSETNVQTRVAIKLSERATQGIPYKDYPQDAPSVPTLAQTELGRARDLFFHDFVRHPDHLGSTWGAHGWMAEAYDSSAATYLSQAIDACSLAYSANVHGKDDLSALACKAYGRSCCGLAHALRDVSAVSTSPPLSCMMLLSLYETISGTKPTAELFHAHTNGQSVTVHMRSSTLNEDAPETERIVWGFTNRQLIWRDLAERNRPTLGVTHWPENTYCSWLEQVADVCGRAKELYLTARTTWDATAESNFAECVNEAVAIDRSVEVCLDTAPADWLPYTVMGPWTDSDALSGSACPDDVSNLVSHIADFGFYPPAGTSDHRSGDNVPYHPRYDVYPSAPISLLWNFVRCARLHLLRTMLDLRQLDDECSPYYVSSGFPLTTAIRSKLSETIHDICASYPYIFGDVPGQPDERVSGPSSEFPALCWVLHKVCCIPGVAGGIREWAIGVFERIGAEKHIRQGFNLAKLYRQSAPKLEI